MARAEIHAELRAMRPWVMTMSVVALGLLTFWAILLILGWQSGTFDPRKTDNTGFGRYLFLLAAQVTGIVLLAPLPFLTLFRFAGSLAALYTSRPSTLRDSLELNRLFWRQAEWLMWAVAWLMAFALVGFACL